LKHILVFSLLPVLLYSTAWAADTQISGPGFVTAVDDGRIHITPAFQLSINDEPPFACSAATRGGIALDSKAHLCVCDERWKLANTDEACAWKSPGK
jgi:hypothetical protein